MCSLIVGSGGEGSSQITAGPLSSQTVYSDREEFLKKIGRKYVEEIWDITKVVCVDKFINLKCVLFSLSTENFGYSFIAGNSLCCPWNHKVC
jgi:hypothetical protein